MPEETKTPKVIPLQGWGPKETGLGLMETRPGDERIHISLDHEDAETITWSASAQEARQVAAALVQRADLIDPPSRRKLGEVPGTPSAIITEELRVAGLLSEHVFETLSDPDGHHRIARLTDGFAIVALMAALEQVAPQRAADVAEQLADCWIDGGSVHEFLWEWREAHAAGRPVGFNPPATLPLAVTREQT